MLYDLDAIINLIDYILSHFIVLSFVICCLVLQLNCDYDHELFQINPIFLSQLESNTKLNHLICLFTHSLKL